MCLVFNFKVIFYLISSVILLFRLLFFAPTMPQSHLNRLAMCAAIDMLASEQLFYGHSPPAGFLTDYTPPVRRPPKLTARGYSTPCLSVLKPIQITLKSATRSCIRMQTDKKKKSVIFADDKGLALEQVRFMTEPSHIPPYWALKTGDSPPLERKPPPVIDVWEIKFNQPASDYLEFRRRITEECVSLENVIIKQNECAADGTIKVKNLDFTKEVLVRTSSDGWRTHEDTYCAFVESGPLGHKGVSMYDTFGFRIQLPIHSRRLDFCVCFRCNGNEYWDNNHGKNYTIELSSTRSSQMVSSAKIKNSISSSPRSDSNSSTPYW